MSQDYPQTAPVAEAHPWAAIDFKTQPKEYLQAVLDYSFEGNVAVNFVPQSNLTRKWFHAPWLHYGRNMREFVSGLTRERGSKAFELAATQTSPARNFAVGFYNDQGGFTIGQVWKNPTMPDSSHVSFPEGTVTFKLLFTTASATAVPYLAGSPEWVADIDRSQDVNTIKNTKVRLLQIDVAVKDARSKCGGWTFGTFHFDSALPGTSPWQKLRPLALMWGNDPMLTQSMFDTGTTPVESWVNPDSPIVKYRKIPPAGITAPKVLGWAGRANGPVDNSISSCLSCHSTAQLPAASRITPPDGLEPPKLRWFRNLAPGEAFDAASKTLDFSLQLGVGIQNLHDFQIFVANSGGVSHLQPKVLSPFMKPSETPRKEWKGSIPQQYRFSRDPED